MSLRRLVFVKTWYILQSRLGGSSKFIHVYLIHAILSACEACKNISLHEACEKNALWSCAVRLPALLNAVCGFNIVAHTEAKLYSAVMFYRFYRCQNFGTQRFLQKTHRFPNSIESWAYNQLRTLFSGHRLARLVPVQQDGPLSGGA